LTRTEFVEMLAAQFDLSDHARESKTALLLELEAMLRHRHQTYKNTALIVDEAQSLPLGLLEEIRLLANIETNDEKLLSVILAGQPELAKRLDDPSVQQLKQRVAVWCEIRRLTLHETASYILSRIRSAGGTPSDVFTSEGVALIHENAKGIPRVINVIADNALLGGFVASQRPVTSRIVQEVCREFRITDRAAASEPAETAPAPTPLRLANSLLAEDNVQAADPVAADPTVPVESEAAQRSRSVFTRVSRRYRR
jgi:type II secretory pathway predicted ATPase ExeA